MKHELSFSMILSLTSRLRRRELSRQAAMLTAISATAILISAVATTMNIRARMSKAIRAWESITHSQSWASSACWCTRKRTNLENEYSTDSQLELRLQYAHAETWYDSESYKARHMSEERIIQSLFILSILSTVTLSARFISDSFFAQLLNSFHQSCFTFTNSEMNV